MVEGDREQLRRVINNIIGNSVKYVGTKRGIINIKIKDIDDKFVEIIIDDNGVGVDEKDLSFLFDRFFRTDASRNSTTGGSGLGLAISKKIIEDHGCRIWATGKSGEGLSIHFTLKKLVEEHKEVHENE